MRPSKCATRSTVYCAATIYRTTRNTHHDTTSSTSPNPQITFAECEPTDGTRNCVTDSDDLVITRLRSLRPVIRNDGHRRAGQRQQRRHSQSLVVRTAPSASLVAALQESGHFYAVPASIVQKTDLSHVSPLALSTRGEITPPKGRARVHTRKASVPSRGLQSLLAQYVRIIDPILRQSSPSSNLGSFENDLDQALLKVLDEEALVLLGSKGYGVTDLTAWAWLLTAKSSETAALRLVTLANSRPKGSETMASPIPTFLYLFLLRRKHISSRALRTLILHAWDRLQGRRNSSWATEEAATLHLPTGQDRFIKRSKQSFQGPRYYQTMSESTIMVMIIRLLRHARKVWPAAFMSIAAMLTKHVNGLSGARSPLSPRAPDERTHMRLTFLYNKVLSLLALPSSMNPFRSVPYHQRAQFTLLRRMSEYQPPLAINREGYRAFARVQLAHRKTLRERDWAELKARSWPPWKEERLGIDAEKGVEYGMSRAQESLLRLKEAGYSMQMWDNAASVLAGWDTDRSPTIQTRTLLRKPTTSHHSWAVSTQVSKTESESALWAARIRATRTVNEAWACFLTWMDRKLTHSQSVYYAMFEKLVFDKKRRRRESNSTIEEAVQSDIVHESPDLPGDSKEVPAVPTSPREAVYVRTPPPSVDDLFNTMVQNGIKPSGRCLAFLLSHAESLGVGMKYLRASNLPPSIVRGLVNRHSTDHADEVKQLGLIPHYLLAAFIKLLSRFTNPISSGYVKATEGLMPLSIGLDNSGTLISGYRARRTSPLVHAFNLISACKPLYRPPWNSLLSSLARPGVIVDTSTHSDDSDSQDMLSWEIAVQLLHQMRNIGLDLDFQGFQIVCAAYEKALLASLRVLEALRTKTKAVFADSLVNTPDSPEEVDPSLFLSVNAEQVIDHGLDRVKGFFRELVQLPPSGGCITTTASAQQPDMLDPAILLPQLMEVPAPAQLHAFVRILGIRQDYDGILDLVSWMAKFAPELRAVAEEARNGATLMRRTLIAVRVFTERSWLDIDEVEDDASEAIMQQIYEVIENIPDWGGWPTDTEVYAYCKRGRFP